jgi:hypothetical protein
MVGRLLDKLGISREFALHFAVPFVLVCVAVLGIALSPFLVGRFARAAKPDTVVLLGAYGDMFGILTALFSGIAFAAIYYTLHVQQKQYQIQLSELNMKREVAELFVDVAESKETFRTQVPGNTSDRCDARYARIVLRNKSRTRATGCRAMITSIETRKSGEQFSVIPESKLTLGLLQPIEKDDAAEDASCVIPHNLPYYFNVCSIKIDSPDNSPGAMRQVAHSHSKYKSLGQQIKLQREYKFHVAVDSDNSVPLSIEMTVSLGDNIDALSVQQIVVERKNGAVVHMQ